MGETALILAASRGYSEVVEILSEPKIRSSRETTERRVIKTEEGHDDTDSAAHFPLLVL